MFQHFCNRTASDRANLWGWRRLMVGIVLSIWICWLMWSCVVAPADLECRPCAPDGDCGPAFICLQNICRPTNATEFAICEQIPDKYDGGE
jgi:hypothetical protein